MTPGPAGRFMVVVRHELRRARHGLVPRGVFVFLPVALTAFVLPAFDFAFSIQGYPQANGAEQAVPGQAVMFGIVILVFFGYTAFDDYGWRTGDRLRAQGATTTEVLGGKLAVTLLHLLAQFTLLIVVGALLFGLTVRGSVAGLALVFVATAVALSAYAFMAFAVSPSNPVYNLFCYLGALVLTAMGGGLAPYTLLPGWAQDIAWASPVRWTLKGSNEVLLGAGGITDVLPEAGVLLVFALVFGVVGLVAYDPRQAKRAFAF